MRREKEEKGAICGRLRLIREKTFGLRGRATFARALGLSPSTYNYYEKGRLPPPDVLARAAQVAGARLQWLITGEDPQELSLGEVRREWLQKLPPEFQPALERFLEEIGASGRSPATLEALAEILSDVHTHFAAGAERRQTQRLERTEGMIPILGRTAAGLVGSYEELLGEKPAVGVADIAARALGLDVRRRAADAVEADDPALESSLAALSEGLALVQLDAPLPSGVVEFVDAPVVRAKFPSAFALRVDGESMAPRFRHGDIVVAVPDRSVRSGQVALVQIRGRVGLTLKLLRRDEGAVHLVPINEKFETERLSEREIEWAAPVLFAVRFERWSGSG